MPTYKPQFSNGGGGVFTSDPNAGQLVLKGPDGSIIAKVSGQTSSEGTKYQLPVGKIPKGATYQIGSGPSYTISDPSQRLEYNDQGGSPIKAGGAGSLQHGPSAAYNPNIPGQFQPSQSGYGVVPAYLGGMFPSASLISPAALNFTNPMQFASQFSPFINAAVESNYNPASDLALKELNTELQALSGFAPAAAALKQRLSSVDNQVNQAQRTSQINQVAPGLQGAISNQLSQAQTYASGRAPTAIEDTALGLNARSAAADQSSYGGFGASSSVARRASDLMDVNQRLQLSQYGNQLLGQNINNTNFLLAPTEYTNAGQQISVNPSLSGSQLASNNLSQLNSLGLVPATAGLETTVQQNELQAQFQQQSNILNSQTLNDFALQKFGYNVNYAGAAAGAAQTDINTQVQLQQQQQYMQIMEQYMQQSQNAQQLGSIFQGIGALGGSGGFGSLMSSVGSLGGKGKGAAEGLSGTIGPVASGAEYAGMLAVA